MACDHWVSDQYPERQNLQVHFNCKIWWPRFQNKSRIRVFQLKKLVIPHNFRIFQKWKKCRIICKKLSYFIMTTKRYFDNQTLNNLTLKNMNTEKGVKINCQEKMNYSEMKSGKMWRFPFILRCKISCKIQLDFCLEMQKKLFLRFKTPWHVVTNMLCHKRFSAMLISVKIVFQLYSTKKYCSLNLITFHTCFCWFERLLRLPKLRMFSGRFNDCGLLLRSVLD